MAKGKNVPPILYDYLRRYQEDPTSRVFAPLAEAYRKAGLVDEALDIAREGLKFHPHFSGGKVALARALFDKKNYVEVIEQLRSVVQDSPDNLVAQRLMAESCLMVGQVAEALTAYKMLLYFHPSDLETAAMVQELESQAYAQGGVVLRTDPDPQTVDFREKNIKNAIDQDPARARLNWIKKVEVLQSALQRVERYRVQSRN